MNNKHDSATIVIPVYNEEDCIEEDLSKLLDSSWIQDFSLVLVDDGSTDGTVEILDRLLEQRGGFALVRHAANLGYGAALKTGIRQANSKWIVITDADNSYPSHRIPELLKIAREKNYDMVVGARTMADAAIPWVRRPAKWCLNKFANFLAGYSIPDLNSGLRVFRRELAVNNLSILCDGFSFTSTITLIAICNYHSIHYLPIDYYPRGGQSKIRPLYDTANFILLILTTVFFFKPLRILLIPAILFTIFGIILAIWQAITFHNITTITVLLFQTGGLLFVLGIISDLIVKTRNRSTSGKIEP